MGTPGPANITTKEALLVYEIETEQHGATRFTSADQMGGPEFERQFTKALSDLTGCHNHVWGHYGTLNDTGGLNVLGRFCVKEIREGT